MPEPENGYERRGGEKKDTGHRRRVEDLFEQQAEMRQELNDLRDLVHELRGQVLTLLAMTGRVNGKVDNLSSFRTFAAFAATVVVPLLIALIGGYFALKAAAPQVVNKP